MTKLFKKIAAFLKGESGATAVEYAVMLALIAAVCIVAIQSVGGESGNFWSGNAEQVEQALQR